MLPTPDTSHIPSSTYPPAEDSFLFLDALSAPTEISYLSSRFKPPSTSPLAVEVGTGSGIVVAFLTANAQALTGRHDVLTLGIDINAQACAVAEETIRRHCETTRRETEANTGVFLGCVNGDLLAPLRPGAVDILLFNPPYVPSHSVPERADTSTLNTFERDSALLALATDGGKDGMEVTERLLQSLPSVLSARGVAYILFCRRNKPELVCERIRSWESGSWLAKVVKDSGRTGGIERLCIVRITRKA